MNAMTENNLKSAFGGESMAHMRYRIWGEKAGKDGFANVERLFLATSDAEQVHATLHFNALRDQAGDASVTAGGGFGLGTTSENLQGAINGEMFEVEQMYPAYIQVAQFQEEDEAVKAMRFAIAAERVHARLFTEAKEAVDADKDLEVRVVELCPVCGYVTIEGDEVACPICGAKRDKFIKY